LIVPSVVSAVKFGASSPRRSAMSCLFRLVGSSVSDSVLRAGYYARPPKSQ
jgi:hypothetical protein